MEKLIRKFILKTIFITLIFAVIAGVIFSFLLKDRYFDTFPFMLLIFPIVSVIAHIQLLKATKKSLARFNIAFMLSFMLKLFVYIGLAATIISLETENKATFVISILLMYLVYTVFDVKMILDDMKKMTPGKKPNDSSSNNI
ncbi:MAG: hypothetical protein L3J35_01130 [Bacteroidales bacterium]|nr:hypothetical protein [Bacteroidales bacterium]